MKIKKHLKKKGDVSVGMGIKVITAVVCGALLLTGLYATISPISGRVRSKFNDMANTSLSTEVSGGINIVSDNIETYSYSQVNAIASSYLNEVFYSANDYSNSKIGEYSTVSTDYDKSKPVGITVNLPSGTLKVIDNSSGKSYTKSINAGPYTFYNLTPGLGGEFTVEDNDGNIIKQGHLRPTGKLRMIYAENVDNVRDIGGWNCDGGTVKYNKIIRGATPRAASNYDKSTWIKLIGIDEEISFETTTEYSLNESQMGNGVSFFRTSLTQESNSEYETLETAKENGKMAIVINKIFDNAIQNKATYYHCSAGADRTGMISLLIEGVLGVSQDNIDKDYEITSFSTPQDRLRSGYYKSYINYINNHYTGNSFRDKVAAYLVSCGVSLNKINNFRSAMIDGAPQNIEVSVDANLYDTQSVNGFINAMTGADWNNAGTIANGIISVNVIKNNGYVALGPSFNVENGKTYRISFKAKAAGAGAGAVMFYSGTTRKHDVNRPNFTTSWTDYSFTFTANGNYSLNPLIMSNAYTIQIKDLVVNPVE